LYHILLRILSLFVQREATFRNDDKARAAELAASQTRVRQLSAEKTDLSDEFDEIKQSLKRATAASAVAMRKAADAKASLIESERRVGKLCNRSFVILFFFLRDHTNR
jgi:predicted  nucleic acid-binding Zn-ribbon protein